MALSAQVHHKPLLGRAVVFYDLHIRVHLIRLLVLLEDGGHVPVWHAEGDGFGLFHLQTAGEAWEMA